MYKFFRIKYLALEIKWFFVKCCGVNNKEKYLDWIKNEKVLNPVLPF